MAEPAAIPSGDGTHFSFGAFNRDFLEGGEGLSMLVLKSADAAADRADFAAHDLRVYEPFGFERVARGPDGAERKVAFSLTFTSDSRLKRAGFFTCQHHYPENFWKAEFQRHANGALAIASAVMVTRDPADFHEFLTHFSGQHEITATSFGISFDLGDGSRVEVLSPLGVQGVLRRGGGAGPAPLPRLAGEGGRPRGRGGAAHREPRAVQAQWPARWWCRRKRPTARRWPSRRELTRPVRFLPTPL